MGEIITAILLGILEGLTEFLPVSSTGHLILATELFGYDAAQWAQFNVVIQLGAILAVVVVYFRYLWGMAMGLLKLDPVSVRFVRNLLIAFMPAAVIGLMVKDQIDLLLGTPMVVGWALVIGGIAMLGLERTVKPGADTGVADVPLAKVIGIGFVQCLAMIPGTSRSGATILGALAMGVGRRTAAEFSFFLAIPTMLGAATVKIVSEPEGLLTGGGLIGWSEIAIGFTAAFLTAMVVIRAFVTYVSRFGFAPFAYYRILAGSLAIVWLFWR